jgi:arginine-tRNA-protein transferase
MIYYKTEYPQKIQGHSLDTYLEKGWYRIGQKMITTDLIDYNDSLIPVFWLRYNLQQYQPSKSALNIIRKNKNFQVKIKNYQINAEAEEQFHFYKTCIDFGMSDTIQEYLQEDRPANVFDTLLIEVRDNKKLIASGYFDLGDATTTSILHFYHPDYKKYSLGKYLILLTLNYSIEQGKKYYYPGYISPEYAKLDYKLFADKNSTELYLREKDHWFNLNSIYPDVVEWSHAVTDEIKKIPKIQA